MSVTQEMTNEEMRDKLVALTEQKNTLLEATNAYAEDIFVLEGINQHLQEKIRASADDLQFLSALEAAGVDNWEGYSHAWELVKEWKEEGV